MRVWVSKENIKQMGYGAFPFKIHDRCREVTILEVSNNIVYFALKISSEDHLEYNNHNLPIDVFIKAYEPHQDAINQICFQNRNSQYIKYKDEDLVKILNKIDKSRILG